MRDSVEFFRRFLRIRTISAEGPNGSYSEAVNFLKSELDILGLSCDVVECSEGRPILIGTWIGSAPHLPSILLNSHYDVVPCMEEFWTTPPFEAEINTDKEIVARGTQDMKCVCIQYIEAIASLKKSGYTPRRTIHLSFVPDEEVGGMLGMKLFVKTERFKSFNVGLSLDEGLANPTDNFTVFYGERAVWWLKLVSEGPVGHGSRFINNTAIDKLLVSVQRFLNYRATQEALLRESGAHSKCLKLGDVTTINLTMLQAGVSVDGGKTFSLNCIPNKAEAGFDIRLPPSVDLAKFEDLLKEWTKEEGIRYEFVCYQPENWVTSIDEAKNQWWGIFKKACHQHNCTLEPEIFPAGTDSRYLRELGIPAFGFSPMNHTAILLHDHNERIAVDVFLRGITIYETVISALSSADDRVGHQ